MTRGLCMHEVMHAVRAAGGPGEVSHPGFRRVWGVRPSRQARGFTLIEILVVVAIIALLITILLPSLRRARAQARSIACAANLRTCIQATMFYAQANRDILPFAGSAWELLHRYVQKVSVTRRPPKSPQAARQMEIEGRSNVAVDFYLCPSDTFPVWTTEGAQYFAQDPMLMYETSYAVNTYLSLVKALPSDANILELGEFRKFSSIKPPSRIVAFCDAGDDDLFGSEPWTLTDYNDLYPNGGLERHHPNGNNFAYADGHVTFHKALLNSPPQYGVPSFPTSWISGWKPGFSDAHTAVIGPFENFVRQPPGSYHP